jgi:hypothetical protein
MTTRARSLGGLVALALSAAAAPALAQPGDADGARRAADLYQQGVKLLQDRRAAEALQALDASLALQRSANTALVRAHALRLLGRKADAMAAYQQVVSDAGERVRAGDDRVKSTLADAGRWIAILRADLGELSVEIAGAPEGTTLSVDGKPTAAPRGADGVARARVWHEPGRVTVTARSPAGEERSSAADVAAGGAAIARLSLGAPAPAPAPPPSSRALPPAATWITWGVGAAGLVTFGVLGAMARSKASELDACSPDCPASLRPDASAGKRDAILANVALGVGAAGLVAGAVVWIVAARSRPALPAASVGLTPGGATLALSGRF